MAWRKRPCVCLFANVVARHNVISGLGMDGSCRYEPIRNRLDKVNL